MDVKRYKIDNDWGMECYTYRDGSMSIDVVMISVPWNEVVETTGKIKDKDEANSRFKELFNKYKNLTGGLIDEEDLWLRLAYEGYEERQ